MIIPLKQTKKTITVNPSLTHAEMLEQIAEGNIYDGFSGGIETTVAEIEEHFVGPDNEDYAKWLDSYENGGLLTKKSLDGTKVLVRICRPYSSMSWVVSDAEIFQMFLNLFDPQRFLTKSEFQAKWDSTDYQEPIEEVI